MIGRFLYSIPVLSIALTGSPALAEPNADNVSSDQVKALKSLQKLDQRLHNIGYRLLSGNADFCSNSIANSGILLHDIRQYGNSNAARTALSFSRDIAINAVASDSPGVQAGLLPNDNLIAINGINVSQVAIDEVLEKQEKEEYRRIAALKNLLPVELGKGETDFLIQRGGKELVISVQPISTCKSDFQIRPSADRDASADGRIVSITSTLAEYVLDDDEFAAIAAHELAHNLLRHRDRLNEEKVTRGFFGQFGKSANRIKATEIEADQLSVWLMVNAGYDPEAAINFWSRYGKEHGKGIFSASTHYRWKKRVKLFEDEIGKMEAAQKVNGKLPPPLIAFEDLAE